MPSESLLPAAGPAAPPATAAPVNVWAFQPVDPEPDAFDPEPDAFDLDTYGYAF